MKRLHFYLFFVIFTILSETSLLQAFSSSPSKMSTVGGYVDLKAVRLYDSQNYTGSYKEILTPEPRCENFTTPIRVSSVTVSTQDIKVDFFSETNCQGKILTNSVGNLAQVGGQEGLMVKSVKIDYRV